ncbi:MAG TPA: hypothetical protein VNQ79_04235 [Blastocatellia bacterium]|nr:hypothetical protein [Blastocatellia bacterium]
MAPAAVCCGRNVSGKQIATNQERAKIALDSSSVTADKRTEKYLTEENTSAGLKDSLLQVNTKLVIISSQRFCFILAFSLYPLLSCITALHYSSVTASCSPPAASLMNAADLWISKCRAAACQQARAAEKICILFVNSLIFPLPGSPAASADSAVTSSFAVIPELQLPDALRLNSLRRCCFRLFHCDLFRNSSALFPGKANRAFFLYTCSETYAELTG